MFQEKALAILKSGMNVFLTGSAGTGKTYTLNLYIDWLKEHKVPVAITASTGIAATHMNGTTIHSWSGIGIKDQLSHNDLRSLSTKQYLVRSIEKTHVLIIDEISMLHRNQLDMINQVLKYLRKSSAPFGGMQVIFAGDFFQLPPISKNNETNREKFAFMSKAWVEASPVVCYLTEQYRQTKNTLNTILNEMRAQEVSEFSVEHLMETRFQEPLVEPTRLFTHNIDVDGINQQELEKIEEEQEVFFAEKKGNQKLLDSFVKTLIVPEKLILKKAAKVMFLKNDHEKGVMNGTLGTVVDFDPEENFPIVKLSDKRKVVVEPAVWSINNEKGNPIVSFEQIPLRLAWAITVHKSQGMTLEAAEIDLGKTFEKGQGYVALSRLKDMDGLRLLGINRVALEVDTLAAKADHRFQELSIQADDQYETPELEKLFEVHIKDSGGTLDKKELAKHRSKSKAKKEKKSTYELSLELIKKGLTIPEIAKERGFSQSTVLTHILKLSKSNPELELKQFKPDKKKLDIIAKSVNKLSNAGSADKDKIAPKLSDIYMDLDKKFTYNDIRLALIFIQ